MLLYYITDRKQFPGTPQEQRRRLLDKIREAAVAGVDFIQLRERDLSGREIEALAREAVHVIRSRGSSTRLLINSRIDIALACGADGVHLRADDVSAGDARALARQRAGFVVGVSCHTVEEVRSAWSEGADFAVFGPVFGKEGRVGTGVEQLRSASSIADGFVIALGGVNTDNARACRRAGASGVAGIRMFQNADVSTLVTVLRKDWHQNGTKISRHD